MTGEIEFDELPEQIRSSYHRNMLVKIWKRNGIYGPLYALVRQSGSQVDVWEQLDTCPPTWEIKIVSGGILRRI